MKYQQKVILREDDVVMEYIARADVNRCMGTYVIPGYVYSALRTLGKTLT